MFAFICKRPITESMAITKRDASGLDGLGIFIEGAAAAHYAE
jgi:hypothetical protein